MCLQRARSCLKSRSLWLSKLHRNPRVAQSRSPHNKRVKVTRPLLPPLLNFLGNCTAAIEAQFQDKGAVAARGGLLGSTLNLARGNPADKFQVIHSPYERTYKCFYFLIAASLRHRSSEIGCLPAVWFGGVVVCEAVSRSLNGKAGGEGTHACEEDKFLTN